MSPLLAHYLHRVADWLSGLRETREPIPEPMRLVAFPAPEHNADRLPDGIYQWNPEAGWERVL